MGAARRDPRRGLIPVTRARAVRQLPPMPGEVVSNTGNKKTTTVLMSEAMGVVLPVILANRLNQMDGPYFRDINSEHPVFSKCSTKGGYHETAKR